MTDYFRLARTGRLPEGFSNWRKADRDGWTIAHLAARYGRLPPDFKGWHWADKYGRTVAHEAAMSGNLPKGFKGLNWADNNGLTVREERKRYNRWRCHLGYGVDMPLRPTGRRRET